MKTTQESKLIRLYLPILLVLIAFFWKLAFINYRDISNDEPFTIFNAQRTAGEIISLSTTSEPNPPLFMLLMHYWIGWFGLSAASVRFLPLLFNAFTVVFVYLAGKRFFGLWTGLLASGMFLVSNYHFLHGVEARTYSLMILATASALYYYLRYADDHHDYWALGGLVFSNLVLVYCHHFGWFVIFAQAFSGIFYVRSLDKLGRMLIPFFFTALGYLPMVPVIVAQYAAKKAADSWLQPPSAYDYLNQLYYFVNYKMVSWVILGVLAAGVLFTLVMVFMKRFKGFNFRVLLLLLWWVIPYTVMFLASTKTPMFNNRYLVYNTIGLYLFVGAAVQFLYQKHKIMEPLAGLVILVLMSVYMRILPNDLGYREVFNSVRYVQNQEKPDRVIIFYPHWSSLQFYYYYDRDIFADVVNYDQRVIRNDGFRVWGLNEATRVVSEHPGRQVIYVQDGNYHDNRESIFNYLGKEYHKTDSVFFPQTIRVVVYEPKAGRDSLGSVEVVN